MSSRYVGIIYAYGEPAGSEGPQANQKEDQSPGVALGAELIAQPGEVWKGVSATARRVYPGTHDEPQEAQLRTAENSSRATN